MLCEDADDQIERLVNAGLGRGCPAAERRMPAVRVASTATSRPSPRTVRSEALRLNEVDGRLSAHRRRAALVDCWT